MEGLFLGFACSSSMSMFHVSCCTGSCNGNRVDVMWCGALPMCWLCVLCLAGLLEHLLLVVYVLLSLLGDLLPCPGLL